ncbi:hypothetical protein AZE42_09808 [Rhizopogon vesiculosus]|uniref:Uncharacterized protein n=1 Tax=Rhizopogon vesiculosus TaxID=180088 RepID=A0A1J8QTQ4_9AGAM|nr:hypothetical protein AZE42_09808 [Rhizopogon vesiculosus]
MDATRAAFGWLCVLHSVTDIAVRAVQIRASQVLPTRHVVSPEFHFRRSNAEEGHLKMSRTNDAFSTDPPVSISLSYLDERQVAPTLLHSRSVVPVPSEQSSMATLSPICTGHVSEPPLLDDLKLLATHAPLPWRVHSETCLLSKSRLILLPYPLRLKLWVTKQTVLH